MQPNFTQNARQRPLQKSMFLQSTDQYPNRNNSLEYQYQDMMKRSSINPDSNKLHNYQMNQNNIQPPAQMQPFNANNNQILNFNSTPRHKQPQRISQFQQFNRPILNSQQTVAQLQQKIQKLTVLVDKHEQVFKKHNIFLSNDKTQIESQIQQIQSRLKEIFIPQIINKQTKDIYEHIFSFKVDINSMKEQINQINGKFTNQFSLLVNSNSNNGSNVNNTNNGNASGKLSVSTNNSVQRIQQPISQLSTNVYSLQNKILQIQRSLQSRNDDIKQLIISQIQKSNSLFLQFKGRNQKTQNKAYSSPSKLKTSTIKSVLSPIMLQYQELFIVKNQYHSSPVRLNTQKFKQQTEIIINSSTYYIDKEGFLLDNQNRYIVDARGLQIKLEDKHLSLLKQHHVLN